MPGRILKFISSEDNMPLPTQCQWQTQPVWARPSVLINPDVLQNPSQHIALQVDAPNWSELICKVKPGSLLQVQSSLVSERWHRG